MRWDGCSGWLPTLTELSPVWQIRGERPFSWMERHPFGKAILRKIQRRHQELHLLPKANIQNHSRLFLPGYLRC